MRSIQDYRQRLCGYREAYVEPANEKMYWARLERYACEERLDRELAVGESVARGGIRKFVRYIRACMGV